MRVLVYWWNRICGSNSWPLISVESLFHFHLVCFQGCHSNTIRVSLLLITACQKSERYYHLPLSWLFLPLQGTEISNKVGVFNHAGIHRICIFDVLGHIFAGLIKIQKILLKINILKLLYPLKFTLKQKSVKFCR